MAPFTKQYKNFSRVRRIIKIAIKHGFHKVLGKIGIMPILKVKPPKITPDEGEVVRVRKMLEELGPTYVKVGQLMSLRPDLMPKEYVDELSKLYDRAEPFPFKEVKTIIESEMGKPIQEVFSKFEEEPIGSASIAQVHRAKLKDGSDVAVKIQRPGVTDDISADIDIMYRLAHLAEKSIAKFRTYQATRVVREVEKMLKEELNFRQEAKNTQRMYENFKDTSWVHIPKIYKEFCTGKVIVMDYIKGYPVTSKGLKATDIDTKEVAHRIAKAMVMQIFQYGFFHADPSPGNVLVIDSKNVAFIDFGAVGEISPKRQKILNKILLSFIKRDAEQTTDALLEICIIEGDLDKEELVQDIAKILDMYMEDKPNVYDVDVFYNIVEISRKHGILIPADFTALEKALFETDSICSSVDPDFDLISAMAPIAAKLAAEKFDLFKELQDIVVVLQNYHQLFKNFPDRVDRILTKAEAGELTVKMDIKGTPHFEDQIDKMLSRIEFSLVICFLLLSTTIVFVTTDKVSDTNYILLLLIILGVWISVILTRRRKK